MKRFSETDKWTKDNWFAELDPKYKLFWLYIIDNCDNVGVWQVSRKMANFLIGYEYSMEDVLDTFGEKIHVFDGGGKWWIKSFIAFQHGELNESSQSKPIISYIALLRKHTLWIEYTNTIHSVQGKGKGKGTGKGTTKKDYSDSFSAWWKVYGKGSKSNAFKRWEEMRKANELPNVPELIMITEKYKAHCRAEERSMKDGEGWINGKFWETDWSTADKTINEDKLFKDYK